MTIAISPNYNTKSFPRPLTLDNKIEIFIDKIKGWQIQPALNMGIYGIPNKEFAQLSIITSFFFFFAKYIHGYCFENKSSYYFRLGLFYTFPDIPNDNDLLKDFYEQIRNGLYHVGSTGTKVIITDVIPSPFAYFKKKGAFMISPDKFVKYVSARFDVFSSELRNPKNADLRAKFESRFDYDNPKEL